MTGARDVRTVRVGPGRQQRGHHVGIAVQRRNVKWRHAVTVRGIDAGTLRDQAPGGIELVVHDSFEQAWFAASCRRTRARSSNR